MISLGYCLLGNGQNSDPGGPLAHTHRIAACKGPMNDIGAPCRFFWDDSFSAAKEGISDHCISSGFVTFMGVSERIAAKDMIQINKKREECNSQDYEGGICGVS